MSHFSTIRTQLRCRTSLLAGLRDVVTPLCSDSDSLEAFLNQAVRTYEAPVQLQTAYSDVAHCEVVVSRSAIGHHTDIGFRLNQSTGIYELVSDDYRYYASTLAQHYSEIEGFSQQVQLRHDRHYAVAQAMTQGFVLQDELVDPVTRQVKLTLSRC
ncbi:hypothetical protein BST81_26565 [Leptolyngbya sp. 'hensonii']|uniref:DUF1257 domain-containing protein n=1 Tax=Leptolyngbya sp. 'hensonii' TaxID=1922337 RepID=UPI0009501FC8|nr:DUF1257 domain-containing protein [Leptolyngbya sp. 'hensonii']OLP15404.1 hypothetical protein BST81_26565 [Leptolyngbya sp. 'hensonii']